MIATDSLRIIVLSGVPIRWLSACRRACSASASALPSAQSSNVQASCLERDRPMAVAAFAGALAARAAAPPGRRCLERQRGAKAEGKIEGAGTLPARKRVYTWGWRGTRYLAAPCREVRQSLVGVGEPACMARSGRMALAGVFA